MNGENRRKEIVECLKKTTTPISASSFAKQFDVSRQVIVQDIAIIRATGVQIASLARGYVLEKQDECTRIFKMQHTDEQVEQELNLIVDLGGTVEDVFIYHKVYGLVRGDMGIKSRRNVQQFLDDIASGKSSLLKNVTSGYHYHTVLADSAETLDLIEKKLREEGFLAPLQEYEPKGLQ